MKHLHDDDLVLYHYGEIRTAPAEGHLSICRGCRDRLAAMRLDLEKLSLAPPERIAMRPPGPAEAPRPVPRASPRPRPSLVRRLLLFLAFAGTDRRG